MHLAQIQALRAWFDRYVRGFSSSDPAIQAGIILKDAHTRRVCENILQIGKSLDLPEEDLHLAEAVALFHDVGRFRQYTVYNTFNDRRSENHALLGIKELEREEVLAGLPAAESDLIKKAVAYHNLCGLPPGLPERCLLFTRLIRDADKLDILRVFTEYYLHRDNETNPALESGLPDTPGCSPVLVENLLQGRGCSYADMNNFNDRKLLMLSWIFDLNFSYTLKEIVREDLINKIIDSLPETGEIKKIQAVLKEYVSKKKRGAV